MDNLNRFLERTSEDYDIPLWLVEKTYKDYKVSFYEKLEEILIERNNNEETKQREEF